MGLLSKQVVTLVVASTIATSSAFAPSLVSPLARRGALSLRSASRYSSLAGGVRMSSQASDKLTGQKFEENDPAKNPGNRPGHSVAGSAAAVQLSPQAQETQKRVQEHQAACQKLSWPEEVRTMMAQKSAFAVLSTISKKHGGFPMGSIVGFAVDGQGKPFFSFSTLSAHTQNIIADPRCSLCVTEANFKGAADARVTLMGNVARVEGAEEEELRKAYMQSHAGAYWAEFKDFAIYRMNEITDISFVGGFARAGTITPEEYMAASPDPLQAFAEPVMSHMNADHTDALKDYVTYLVGVEGGVDSVLMKRLDKYGFDVRVAKGTDSGILRIPFPAPVLERKGVKEAIVALSQQVAKKKAEAEAK